MNDKEMAMRLVEVSQNITQDFLNGFLNRNKEEYKCIMEKPQEQKRN